MLKLIGAFLVLLPFIVVTIYTFIRAGWKAVVLTWVVVIAVIACIGFGT